MIPADVIVMAIGAVPELGNIKLKNSSISLSKQGTVIVNLVTLETNAKGVFAGGDAVSGGATVVEALADGEQAAISIERFLNDEDMSRDRFVFRSQRQEVSYLEPTAEVKVRFRPEAARLHKKERLTSFKEVEKGYNRKEAHYEADRCLRCDRKES